ncbi:Retrovirus-related Pol polyprotein from transposon TNT 1-94 [Vitis vinifera]|uniref:Retrovirus-related Pol polyprotein from transposon TNT 1-94 n=1 Tax=Vitis vinifera TaxID=29760 RepID=A0A438GYK5_VITVI|nr:Retrovirus-related Pol polyprotein from transposon TNT 1-94 [Vitis vinifera]
MVSHQVVNGETAEDSKGLKHIWYTFILFLHKCSHKVYDDSWIIDSSATDHMTSKSQLFHTYTPSPSNKKIIVANGSLATVRRNKARGRGLDLLRKWVGILHDSSCVNTPQQNGVVEMKNRHLLNTTRVLLFQGNVPKSYWGEAVLIATYMINRIPSRVLDNKIPVEILKSFYPHFRTSNGLTLGVFGCIAFVHVYSQHRDKLDPRAIKCVFLGYSSTQKGYKCYNPLGRKFYISIDVTFIENKPFFPKSSLKGEISMMEDSLCESFEPLDLPHVSTHGDEKPDVTRNFPQFPKVYSREKVIPEQKEIQESNSDTENEITVRSDPPLHTQPAKVTTLSSLSTRLKGVTALLAYVDDIIVTGNDEREKHEVKQRLATEFEIKELGKLNSSVLRWHIPHKGSSSINKTRHHLLVSVINQFMHDPREPHLQAAALLERQPEKGILFKKNNTLALDAYTNADYAGF